MTPVLTIDGSRFVDYEGFQREFSELLDDHRWHGNLDALNDILRGGFGTPDGNFVLRWINSDRSRETLGADEAIRCFGQGLGNSTLFESIVDIIVLHGPGGSEEEDGARLELA